MKKVITVFLVLWLCLSSAACGNTEADAKVLSTPTATAEATAFPALTAPATAPTATDTEPSPVLSATPQATRKATPKPTQKPTQKPVPTVVVTPKPTQTATPAPTAKMPTLAEYIASVQSEIDEMTASLAAQGLNMKVEARGNSLVYVYQYAEDLADIDTMKVALEQSMEGTASTFDTILAQLKAEIPSAESIIVEYLSKDGTLIYSREFK